MTVGVTNHVSIGGHEYLVKPFSYSKRQAPMFGARFSTGDPDFNNLGMWQHWAQRCWIGGVGQDLFQDDAMYDEGVGVDTSDHEKVTITRDLSRGAGSNWALGSGTTAYTQGARFIIYNSKLYLVTLSDATVSSKLWEYAPGTDGWTQITSLTGVVVRSIATFDGKLFVGGLNTAGTAAIVKYASGALSSWTTLANPAGLSPVTATVRAMKAFQRKLYVAYGTQIWRLKDDETWDGNTIFYKADQSSDSNYMNAMEVHLGFLYMLSANGHVHRTDGNTTFDIWNWDGQTIGISIRSFDGRLFILTFEYTNTTSVGYGVLYQMSGSAVTQLKRWGNENQATAIGNMTVFDRKLFYGASNLLGFGSRVGFGVAQYDPIEDAHSIISSNADTGSFAPGSLPYPNYVVDDQAFFEGNLFAVVRGHGGFRTPYGPTDRVRGVRRYDTTSAGGSVAATNGGWFTTSTYDAGTPGVLKLWRKVAIDATIKTNTAIVVDYSTNNGISWTTIQSITTTGTRAKYEININATSTSIKLRFTLRTTSSTVSPELWGFVVSYIPVPEPNWMWSMTLVLSESQALMDGSTRTMDTESEMAFLEDLQRARALVTYIDIDGVQWATNGAGAFIYDIDFRVAQMTQPLEGEVVITLLEAVETY